MKKKKRKKNRKKNKNMKLWEKVFVLTSVSLIFIIMGIYLHRASYYYKKLYYIEPHSKLIDVITNENNITYNGDGLYKEDNNYYYKGKETHNYLLYNGILWRIISIDESSIKLITDNNITSLIWGNNTNYENSLIYSWLNDKFLNSLNNPEYIINNKWCNSSINTNQYNCNNDFNTRIGLINISEYAKAGGVNSYLNNETYFWTINYSNDNKAYYIHNLGGINNDVGENNSLYSYGVRPSLYINSDLVYEKGDGTKDNPYIVSKSDSSSYSLGEYLSYKDRVWRIIEIDKEYIKIILDNYLIDNEEPIKISYDKVSKYLNNEFLKTLDTNDLVKINFSKTKYNYQNNYNYLDISENKKEYVGIPSVGDYFITDYEGIWLDTYQNTNQKLIYTISSHSSLLADLSSSENYIRPIIAIKSNIKVSAGNGQIDNPYKIGDSK